MASSPFLGAQEIRYLFIDGGCLRATLNDLSTRYVGGQPLVLDFDGFTQLYSKVFYYDALPARQGDEVNEAFEARVAPQLALHEELRAKDRFHVYEGDVRRARSRRERPEQKKVDVMIAVDMLTHSFKRNMHRATLLTSDLDFTPLISALVQEGMFVTLWYPPKDTHVDLIAAADGKIPLQIDSIYDHLTATSKELFSVPQSVTEPVRGDFAPTIIEWEEPSGHRLRIYEEYGGRFTAERKPLDKNIATYATHSDQNVLRMFINDTWQVAIPDEAEQPAEADLLTEEAPPAAAAQPDDEGPAEGQ